MKRLIVLLALLSMLLPSAVHAQHPLLQCGPMVGFSDMKQVKLWVQTRSSAEVIFAYRLADGTGPTLFTDPITTASKDGYTAEVYADSLSEGKTYSYTLYLSGEEVSLPWACTFQTQSHWQYRYDPPPFRLATGSCAYINEPEADRPGTPYGSDYGIFNTIHEAQPDLMLWLGDNVYYREPDWFSKTGMIHRYTHSRSIPELQPLLGSTHHYAIWDDHDYGPNDSDRGYHLKDSSLAVFDLFWANPGVGLPGIPGAITTFQWSDVDFFLLDNRYYRAPDRRITGDRTILGEAQLQWLIDALVYSDAPFKIIAMGGQFLSTSKQNETYSNFGFDKERQRIIDLIYAENIKGVIFLTGDRHHSELSILKKEGKPTIYDLTVSSLTAGLHTNAAEETNELRVEGSLVIAHDFATLDFSGPRKNRELNINLIGLDGKSLYTYRITQADL